MSHTDLHDPRPANDPGEPAPRGPATSGGLAGALIALARPRQWSKGVFILLGPVYGLQDPEMGPQSPLDWVAVAVAFAAFALASSGCYVFNDLADIEEDRAHPRKRSRPLASGAVPVGVARVYGTVLLGAGLLLPLALGPLVGWARGGGMAALTAVYIGNVLLYSGLFKRKVVLDVMSLSMGFVLRCLVGCLAAAVTPTTWLLNASFFLSMFLAFGKRLGERRSMGDGAAAATRSVQESYTSNFLRMVLVVTGGVTLVTYGLYIESRHELYTLELLGGINVLWFTLLPASYCLMRAMLLVEQGAYDDPTELATSDRPFQLVALLFAGLTVALIVLRATGLLGASMGPEPVA